MEDERSLKLHQAFLVSIIDWFLFRKLSRGSIFQETWFYGQLTVGCDKRRLLQAIMETNDFSHQVALRLMSLFEPFLWSLYVKVLIQLFFFTIHAII